MPRYYPFTFANIEKAASVVAVLGLAGAVIASVFSADALACGDSPDSESLTARQENQVVKVVTKREGHQTRFFVDNKEYCEVTMTFEFALQNLKGVERSFTMVFPPRKLSEAFVIEPTDASGKWDYSYTNYYKLGTSLARHDQTFLYGLPYAPGERFKVTQAYGGSFSHKGSNKYAIDWKMPTGSAVHAARGGEVVKTRADSSKGGPSMKFDAFNNFVLIRHDDGTLGHYCHLLKDSVVVKPGERVVTGQMLAKSGNTGFSSGPHLHFCVFKTSSGKERESVPVKFRTEGEVGTTLLAGRNYRATVAGTENASVRIKATEAVASAAGAGGS